MLRDAETWEAWEPGGGGDGGWGVGMGMGTKGVRLDGGWCFRGQRLAERIAERDI